ncbi:HAD hydrolase-like protein [Lacticaseibacillus manihotivorans]|nr:HAD hydrolase-like protein [Lacticaseibacillus manihotivorans]
MIGDRDTDMQGGLNNHVQTLGVTYGFGSAEELKQAHAAAIVATPQAIPAGISQLMA